MKFLATHFYGTPMLAVDGKHIPSENELTIARHQGNHVTQIFHALKNGRNLLS